MEAKKIDISTGIIYKTILILLAVWFLYVVRDIIALLFISVIIVSAIDPAIDWMQRKKIPRPLGVVIIYILIFSVIGLSVSFLIPPLVKQFGEFGQKLPEDLQKLENLFQSAGNYFQGQNIDFSSVNILGSLSKGMNNISSNIFTTTIGVFSGFVSTIVVLVIVFYMAVKEDGIKKSILSIVPQKQKEYATTLIDRIKIMIGRWLQGQIILMLIIFLLDFIGLSIIGVPYALSLAIFAGLMEIVPYIGPIISAIPGIILGLFISPLTAVVVTLLYIIVQQFENYVVVPQVMKRAVQLNPVIIILALLVGLKLGGVLGAILAIPVATAIGVFVGDLMKENA